MLQKLFISEKSKILREFFTPEKTGNKFYFIIYVIFICYHENRHDNQGLCRITHFILFTVTTFLLLDFFHWNPEKGYFQKYSENGLFFKNYITFIPSEYANF